MIGAAELGVSLFIRFVLTDLSNLITFLPVTTEDFDALSELRISAMKESLERVGRFNPERARERLKNSFYPEHSKFIVFENRKIGFYTFRLSEGIFHLDHFYIHPDCQSLGIGSFVMRKLVSTTEEKFSPIRLGALKESASNRFYQRHGFIKLGEDDWDIYYERSVDINKNAG